MRINLVYLSILGLSLFNCAAEAGGTNPFFQSYNAGYIDLNGPFCRRNGKIRCA